MKVVEYDNIEEKKISVLSNEGSTNNSYVPGVNSPMIDGTVGIQNMPTQDTGPDLVGWSTDIVWSATDSDTVAWTAGTIKLADGTSYTVNSGNTGNITSITYVYYDGTTTAKITTVPQDAVGTNKIMLCVAKNSTSPTFAQYQAFGTLGQSVFITADNIAANTITANQIAANTITANQIAANTITATQINSGYVYAGNIDASQITAGTITGRTLQTGTSGQRVVIDSSVNTIQFYDSGNNDCGFMKGLYLSAFGGYYTVAFSKPISTTIGIFTNGIISGGTLYPDTDGTLDLGNGSYMWNNLYLNGGLNFDNGEGILTEVSGTPRWSNGTNYGILISDKTTSTSNLTAAGKISVNIAGTTFKLLYNNT